MEDLCEQFLKNSNTDSDLELLLLGIELLEQITTSYQNNIVLSLDNNSTAMRLLKTKQTSKNN